MKTMGTLRRMAGILGALVLVSAAACEGGDAQGEVTSLLVDRSPAADEIVMRVDGRSVTLAEAQAHWERHPQWTREELVEALTRREALISAALREGLPTRDLTLEHARTRGLARAWLAREIEAEHRPEDLQKQAWEPFLEQAREELVQPAGWEVAALEILYPSRTPEGAPIPEADEATLREAAKMWFDRIVERLGDSPTPEALVRIADSVRDSLPAFLRVQASPALRFPSTPAQPAELGPGWHELEPKLRESLEEVELAPDVPTAALATSTGWMLFVPRERLEAASATAEELEERARALAIVEKRREATEAAVEGLRAAGDWSIDAEALEEAWAEQAQTR